jgi:TRAP transporter 4TM/12TM fusion protein
VESFRKSLITLLGIVLCFYTILFVNYNVLQPQSALALFIMIGMVLCFLVQPSFKWLEQPDGKLKSTDPEKWKRQNLWWNVDIAVRWILAAGTAVCFLYIFVQTEPWFSAWWPDSDPFTRPTSLGNRSGDETQLDYWIGIAGLALVLEATRRSIGWIVPALALLFIFHAYFAPDLPDWLLPHRGLKARQIVSATFLQSLGVLGPAASVMFRFVFLFVVFGAFLEMSGATQFIIDFSEKVFGRGAGGPAKVSVIGSGLMGSLSGSAVANAVTTGSFTIPMMRNAGFQPHVAGGITAAAATGGALVPPVMGAGAYMMLEFVERAPGQPQVTFIEIAKAAMIPAFLYYFSLWMIVHFFAKKIGAAVAVRQASDEPTKQKKISLFEAIVFFGALGFLILLLLIGFSPFKAVTGSLVVILVLAIFRKQLKLGFAPRVLALIAFLGAVVAHQFTTGMADWPFFENNVWSAFLCSSWENPGTGEITGRRIFDSLLGSSFIGMLVLLVFGLCHPVWRPQIVKALTGASKNGIALVAASACVGIIIGIVQTTPIANDFGEVIKSIVETNLLLALIGIMACSLVLGMGVPSVVCYLLMATLMGSLLGELGVDPLAAHMFIFYFGMMSMVTPPVALAAYASASIAGAPIMKTALSSFQFSLVGFTLPFMFIYRPALLLMGSDGETLHWFNVVTAVVASTLGVIALAACVTGYLRNRLGVAFRIALFVAAILLLAPKVGGPSIGLAINIAGGIALVMVFLLNKPDVTETGSQ